MLTLALYGLLAIVVAGVLFLLAAYLLPAGEQIAPPIRDEPVWELPSDKRLDVADVANVRLPVALRGYRFAETDLLLDRLGDELQARDEEIARLRGDRPDAEEAAEAWEPAETSEPAETAAESAETPSAPSDPAPGDAADRSSDPSRDAPSEPDDD